MAVGLENSKAATAISEDAPSTDKHETEDKVPHFSFGTVLASCLTLLKSRAATPDNSRVTGRVLRMAVSIRRNFNSVVFVEFVEAIMVAADLPRGKLLVDVMRSISETTEKADTGETIDKATEKQNEDALMIDSTNNEVIDNVNSESTSLEHTTATNVKDNNTSTTTAYTIETPKDYEQILHDIDLFFTTLGLIVSIDRQQASSAVPLANSLINELSLFPPSHKYDDLLVAKGVFYVCRVYELCNKLVLLAGFLMNVYRTAVLHHSKMTQAVAMNLILRNFLQSSQYEQAVKFLDKTSYPDNLRSNAQHARYLYYLARILAVRLNYAEGYTKVTQAIRRAPQEGTPAGKGFRLAANKLSCVIQLLLGDIPEHRLFNQKDLRNALEPYRQIVQAVRSGDLASFRRVMEKHEPLFERDGNVVLIQRLRHNVIRAGLRKIAASYSCISFADVAVKLGLDSNDDPECIVSRAIADGVITATIDSINKTVHTKLHVETQASVEPRKAFHGRIAFCLQLHNEAVRAMQYPEPKGGTKIEEAEARRKEHQEQLARAEKDEFEGGDDTDLL